MRFHIKIFQNTNSKAFRHGRLVCFAKSLTY